jgi:hypothetical protein
MRNPPISGPDAGPRMVANISTRPTATRSRGGKVRKSIAIPTGVSMPPPAPCSTRKATSCSRLCAIPHSAEAVTNIASAIKKIRLVPKRSPSQPDAGMNAARLTRYPMTTASVATAGTLNSLPRVASATMTIVESRVFISIDAT